MYNSAQQKYSTPTIEKFKLPSHHFVIGIMILFIFSVLLGSLILTRLHFDSNLDVAHRNLHNISIAQEYVIRQTFDTFEHMLHDIAYDLENHELASEVKLHRYELHLEQNSAIHTLWIMDSNQNILWNSNPATETQNLLSSLDYGIYQSNQKDKLYIAVPVKQNIKPEWLIPISFPIYDDTNSLSYIIVGFISSRLLSDSLNQLDTKDKYLSVVIHDDGTYLMTVPYDTSLIGQSTSNRFEHIAPNGESTQFGHSSLDGSSVLMNIQSLDPLPLSLVLEISDTAKLFQADNVVIMITLIAVVTIGCSLAFIMLYSNQYRALRLQTANLSYTNRSLQNEIQSRSNAEVKLSENQERYQAVTELISDYAFSILIQEDGSMVREWLTDSFYAMTGYDKLTFGTVPNPNTRTHPNDIEQVKADIHRTIKGKETVTEYRWRIQTGDYIWTRVKRRPVWDKEEKRVIRIIGAVKDITAEKEVELALRESEDRYRKVTELISNYAFSIIVKEDGELQRDWLTPSYYRLMGYSEEEINTNATLKMIAHPDDMVQAVSDLERVLNGETVTSEIRMQTKFGTYIWLQISRLPVWDKDANRVTQYYGVAKDITAQKEAELALRESENRYRFVSDIISDYAFSIYIADDGNQWMEWVTDSIALMTGFAPDEIMQHGTKYIHPDDIGYVEADIQRTLHGEDTITEYRSQVKTGDYIWLRVKRRPIWDEKHQRVIRFMGAGSDITAEKETELVLRESEDRYRRISNILSDFAYESAVYKDGKMEVEWVVGNTQNTPLQPKLVTHINEVASDAHPDDIRRIKLDLQKTLSNIRTVTEYRARDDEGKYRWVRSIREPIWDEQETRVNRILGTVKDITAEKEAELALEMSQQRYQEVTELMSDYAFSITIHKISDNLSDIELGIDWVVGSLEQITGITFEELVEEPNILTTNVYPDDNNNLRRDLQKTLTGHKTSTKYRIIHAQTHEIRWVQVTRQPIWNADHTQVERILAGATDITAQKEAEVALRESESRYRLVSELISDYVFSIKLHEDYSTEVEWIAGSYEQITGANPKDISQISQIPKQVHPDDYVRVTEDIWRTNYGETTISEYRMINEIDGSVRWVRVSRQPILDEDEERVIRVIGAVSDITIEKTTDEALRESEDRYRVLTDLMSDYVYSLAVLSNDNLELEWFAGSFEQITGVHIDEFKVQSPKDMVKGAVGDDYATSIAEIDRVMAGESVTSEYSVINMIDNQPRWLRASRFPIIDDKTGQVIRILGAVRDITAQKLAERALQDSEMRYRMLTELMTDFAYSVRVEPDGRLYREWLVGDFESVMGFSIEPSGYVTNDNLLDVLNSPKNKIDIERTFNGELTTTEYQILHLKSGEQRWIRTTRQPIWDNDHKQVVRFLGAVKDITLEKEAEFIGREADKLRQALEREKSLHRLRSRFVSMVTHEFRNPLAAILSSASLLDKYNERLTEESRQEKFGRIYGQVSRMTNLLEDLLQVGELEHHALNITKQRVDIVYLIRNLYEEFEESIANGHSLILESQLPAIHTFADWQFLRQALGNIISNAIKYSPPNSDVICDVRLRDENIVIHVIDHGMGIPEKDQEELFEAFFRASNVSTQPGTGLGLLIAKQAIELHNGTLAFESELGNGTTFIITIPRVIGKEHDM